MKCFSKTDIGLKRSENQDRVWTGMLDDDAAAVILCDGMGGHEKGEVASATVCETMSKTILSRWTPNEPLSDELLQQAIAEAYDALDAKDNGEERKMGTTMTFVCFHAEGVTVAHIGDSRVYQLRPATKKEPASIVFKTRDHSLVNDLIDIGEITEEEAKNHPQKNVITRAMQPCQERRAKATIAHLTDIREGDYFYMCSDGMLEQTTDDNLLFIVTNKKKSDKEKVEMLREVTKDNKDNHTAHLIYIDKVKGNVPVAASASSDSQGVWITPQSEKPKKNILFIAAAIIIAVIAIAASFFLFHGQTEGDAEGVDTVVVDSIKKDTTINNLAGVIKRDTARTVVKDSLKKDSVKNDTAKSRKTENKSKFTNLKKNNAAN